MPSTTNLAALFKKHVVLLISQKDYVTIYILPRWIIDYWAGRKYYDDKLLGGASRQHTVKYF